MSLLPVTALSSPPAMPSTPIQLVDLTGLHSRLKPHLDKAIQHVIGRSAFINGPEVGELECALSAYLGVPYTVGCANGTDALIIALRALEIGAGDEVITTPFTFAATVEAIMLVGATPVYCDINPETFNLDPSGLEAVITPKTKAIMPVHLYGQPAEIDSIFELATRHGLYLIEDNAQSFGARWKTKLAGSFGHFSTTSFFPAKNLGAFGDAGAVFTSDPLLYERAKLIAQHGAKVRYTHERLGFNSRLDTLQAAVLSVKLPHLDEFNRRRREAAQVYNRALSIGPFSIPFVHPDAYHIYHQYTLLTPTAAQRKSLQSYLLSVGIPSSIHYPISLNLQTAFQTERFPKGSLPVSESVSERVLSLPMHTELTAEQIEYITYHILYFFQHHA